MTARRDPGMVSDAPEPGDERGRRFLPPLPRAIARPDVIARRVLAAVVVLGLLGWGATMLATRAGRWLHARPEYAISFGSIQLDPPPPEYVQGGSSTILKRVRNKANLEEPIPILDQDLDELGRLFAKYSPWVVKVERVRLAFPDKVTVQLLYREPVARIDVAGAGSRGMAVSADGVVLPGEEVSASLMDRLVTVAGNAAGWSPIPGRLLAMDARGEVAPEVVAALRLARLFHSQDPGQGSPPPVAIIYTTYGLGKLMVTTRHGHHVLWKNGPGDEADGEFKSEEKLKLLTQWELAHRDLKLAAGDYLVFSPQTEAPHIEPKSVRDEREAQARREGVLRSSPIKGKQ